MMIRATFFLLTTLLSLSVVAANPDSVVLEDGSIATVLSGHGKTTLYIKEVKVDEKGRPLLVQGEVFSGEQLVRTPNGECLQRISRLIAMNDFQSGEFKVQLPKLEIVSRAVSCKS